MLHVVEDGVGRRVGHLVDDVAVGEEQDAVGVAARRIGSCVTMTTVWPQFAYRACAGSRAAPRRTVSPAHRSARRRRRSAGCPASARAAATRCCWPPESSAGRGAIGRRGRRCRRSTLHPRLVRLAAGDADRQHDVLRRRQCRQQVERLEDEADLVTTQQRQRLVVERGDLGVADVDLARRGPVEAGEHVQQGRLAGAGRPHDRGELAGLRRRRSRRRVRGRRRRRRRRPC